MMSHMDIMNEKTELKGEKEVCSYITGSLPGR